MQKALARILLCLLCPLASGAAAAEAGPQAELLRISNALLDTIESGDKEPWRRYLTDDFILVDRDGSIKRKQELVDGTSPLPAGYTIALQIVEPETRVNGNSALLVYRVIEKMEIFGQAIHVEYRTSKFFRKDAAGWKLVTWQYVELPKDPPPTAVDAAGYDALVGEYALTDDIHYTVTRRGNALYGVRSGRKETELVPESESVFYVPGTEWRKIFVRDGSGRAVEILDRRKGTDLRWKRVK